MVVSKRDDCVKGYSIVILTGDERSLVRAFRAFLRQVTGLIGLADAYIQLVNATHTYKKWIAP